MQQQISVKNKSVLVVDDSALVRLHLKRAFLSDGFSSCIEAENGREAISLARKNKPHLIILDLAMPIMNGLEAAPILRSLLPTTPIILFTLHADSIRQQDLSNFGITAAFLKSDSIYDLIHKAHELVD